MNFRQYFHRVLKSYPKRKNDQFGFTFVELIVTIIILSIGIVAIFQSLIISLDRISNLTNRLYASNLLDNRISYVQRMLKAYKALPFESEKKNDINVAEKIINLKEEIKISQIDDLIDIFKLELSVSWNEQNKTKSMIRSAYISEF